ncbi:MAG: phytase [Burkholderiales bacterium]|nr:phytase [Burkholderiales bacterium]
MKKVMKTSLIAGLLLALSGALTAQPFVMDGKGLQLRAGDGRELDRLPLRAKRWDQRGDQALLADANSGELLWVEAVGERLRIKRRWQPEGLEIECLALYRDAQGLLQALLLGDDGRSQHWLLDGPAPRLIRPWATPPKPQACAVRDAEAQLYVAEEGVGLWQIDADAEREGRRLLQVDPAADAKTLSAWLAAHPVQAAAALPLLPPSAQTAPVSGYGDAADDPAIWVHPRQPARSLILGTNKKQGLLVYDLQGRQRQFLAVGRVNNVDLRQDLRYGGQRLDLAVATQRDESALVLFGIARDSGRVRELARLPTGLEDVYGVCSLRNDAGRLEVLVNDKDGRVRQFEILRDPSGWQAVLRREFRLPSQPEGCVVDEASGQLFIGEEDAGIWRVAAAANAPATPERAIALSEQLHADVEGLAVYRRGGEALLVVSSQGNDSYALYDLAPPHRPRGSFRIGINAAAGIDGASETDGLEVTSANLGGPYRDGLLVVQDGRNNLPRSPQNFKLLPWSAVVQSLLRKP